MKAKIIQSMVDRSTWGLLSNTPIDCRDVCLEKWIARNS